MASSWLCSDARLLGMAIMLTARSVYGRSEIRQLWMQLAANHGRLIGWSSGASGTMMVHRNVFLAFANLR